MDYRKVLRPRYCFDRAVAKLWNFAPELSRSHREPGLEDPSALRESFGCIAVDIATERQFL